MKLDILLSIFPFYLVLSPFTYFIDLFTEEVIGDPTTIESQTNKSRQERQRCHSDLEASTSLGSNHSSGNSTPQRNSRFRASLTKMSPDVARRSFGRLGRTLR